MAEEMPWVVVHCEATGSPGIATAAAAAPRCQAMLSDARGLGARAASAREFLHEHGFVVASDAKVEDGLVLVDDAPLSGSLTVPDLAPWLGPAWAGRVGVLFGKMGGNATSEDPDLVTHELVHVWLRQSGATEPRWVEVDGHMSNEPALLQEAIADFVAAARSGDPFVGRRSWPDGVAPRSLKVAMRCPDDLRGEAHDDGQVLSSALWEARDALGGETMLSAIAKAAPGHTGRVADLAASVARELAGRGTEAARTWSEIARRHALDRCDEPIALRPGARLSARRGDFVLPGAGQVAGVGDVRPSQTGPQTFAVDFPVGTTSLVLSLRAAADRETHLSVVWKAEGSLGPVNGEAALVGGAVRSASIDLPQGASRVVLRVASRSPRELAYNDLVVTLGPRTIALAVSPTPTELGCAGAIDPVALGPLLMALLLLRRMGLK